MQTIKTDVLVIGSGGAGLRAAIELHDKNIDVIVVGKCARRDAHTILATGGINAALKTMDKKDSWQLHAADTLRDGGEINNPKAVKLLCKHAPRAVQELVSWGMKFHREKNGRITQRFFGAATYRRACFAGDYTGREILNVLVNQVAKRRIKFKSNIYIFSLLTNKGKVNGALGFDVKIGKLIVFHAKVVVLATGGYSRMFQRSSSRFWENNGDGIKLACDVSATLMDMEMLQFHPTGMIFPKEAEGILVTEAVRGEGGILINAKGERFMHRYDKERMELSARDIVARAIYLEVQAGRGTQRGGVLLDISHRPKEYILKRLPKMFRQFQKYASIDISKQKMEVAPTAHYSMGGVFINHSTGKTTVPRLYAIGEVTVGVHGANRLGGNSLAEIMVFGRLTAQQIVRDIKNIHSTQIDETLVNKKIEEFKRLQHSTGKNPMKIMQSIQQLMWEHCGVARNAHDMKKALILLEKYARMEFNCSNTADLVAALNVKNMIFTSEMILRSALLRKESRGAHYRTDYPILSKMWKKNILCVSSKSGYQLKTRQVAPIQKELKRFIKCQKPPTHRLME
ncbi:FAD-binding protein [Candidatus Woesearchaeota archaeon]|nr:FAD-binding protein [Candidatus Woesearchaeota archaeon]